MDDDAPRVRRRLRQRSDRAPPPSREVHDREIIAIDSSSDEFVPSSPSHSDASDSATAKAARKTGPRGRKRLRRPRSDADSANSSEDDDAARRRSPTSIVAPQAPAGASQSDEWECTRCTYLNEPQRLACELCLSARASPKPTRKLSAWLATAAAVSDKPKQKPSRKAQQPVETIDSSDDGEPVKRERPTPRRVKSSNEGESGALWAESSLAQQIDELCVQKKKVQEVQEWLQYSLPSRAAPRHGPMKRLLFLCGPPGSGKSTTVRHLANAMGVTIKEWRDNASAGKLQYHRYLRDEFQTTHVSAWDDFIDFINRSVNYSALQVAAIPGKQSRKFTQPRTLPSTPVTSAQGQLILIENWPQSPFGSSQDSAMWDEKLMTAFRQVVNPTANLQYPVVCIFSDVRDKKVDATQLAKVFSEEVVRSPFTSIINFNPVTAAQMKKTLLRTLEKLDCSISQVDLAKTIERSDGDIRHAINMAQLVQKRQALKKTKRTNSKPKNFSNTKLDAPSDGEDEESSRDPFYSDFHIVGKLLHSKNIKAVASQSSYGGATESRLVEFDRILDSSVMPLDRVLALLHSNCSDYFTEIEDLGDAIDLMSQSETWLHDAYRTTSSSAAFKTSHDIVRSVVVRSIALTNKNPAPSAFRPITAPRTYDTTRRMVSSRQDSLLSQQEMTGGAASTHPYLCRGDVYAFEIQPFVDVMQLRGQPQRSGSSQQHNAALHGTANDLVVDDEIENSDGDGW